MSENLSNTALESSKPADNPRPELSAAPSDKKPVIIAGVIVAVVFILLIVLTVVLFNNEYAARVLADIAIFYTAFMMIVVIFLLLALVITIWYLALKVNDLTQLLGREIQPLLTKAQSMADTADTTVKDVQSRVTVVSDEAVKPILSALSFFAGVRAVLDTLFKRN